jgi:hypothetical protein
MPYVDVAVVGQVTNGALRYSFENPVVGTNAIDVLGYSIKRTHTNIHEGNCFIDFKVGSTSLSSIRIVDAGASYDPDNPPRHDNTSSDSPSLGVEVSLAGDIESRGHGISLPDYIEIDRQTVTIVRSPKSPEFGSSVPYIHVAAPFEYAYRLWYLLSGTTAAPSSTPTINLSSTSWKPVYIVVRSSWFALSAADWRQRFLAAHNTAATVAMGAVAPVMEFSDGVFSIVRANGFRVVDLNRLSYVLCGMSTARHPVTTYVRHKATTALGAVEIDAYSLGSTLDALFGARIAIRPASQSFDSDTHDSRYAAIQRSIAIAQRASVDAVCGEVYSARLRPGQYPIGSVLHSPYPVVLDVEEASGADPTDSSQVPADADTARRADWVRVQRDLGARPQKSLSITRRQAADGLIKELQDAMNYAVHASSMRGSGVVDPHSLPSLMPQYTSVAAERPSVMPFVYDPNVPHMDNPARYVDTDQFYRYEYDIGHQSAVTGARRMQSVYVTLEDAGGGPDASGRGSEFASGEPSLETSGWNGYKCTRVRICTAEARNGDTRQGISGIEVIATDEEACRGGAIKQNITLLFASGPNRGRSVHRALGFEDRDYASASKFVLRKPRIAVFRVESAGISDLQQTTPSNDGQNRLLHIVNDPGRTVAGPGNELMKTSGIIEGHTYTFEGRVYTRYVPVLSVAGADAAPYDTEFHYQGGTRHFAYYTVLGFQAPHAYNLDTDPLLISMGVAVNERTHTDADCVAGAQTSFALLSIGHADHAEPRTYRDGSVYQHAMLQYKLSGYVTAPHAVGIDRPLAGFRNFGRVAPNVQDASSRRWGALATDATALATRDCAPTAHCVHMFKAGDFGVKRLQLDEPTRVGALTLTFSVPGKTPYPYNFGAQEVVILLRLHRRSDRSAPGREDRDRGPNRDPSPPNRDPQGLAPSPLARETRPRTRT